MPILNLQDQSINSTFDGLLHAQGEPLQNNTQVRIYDGAGNASAIYLGKDCGGLTVCGLLSSTSFTTASFTGNILISTVTVPVTLTSTGNPIQIGPISSTNMVMDDNDIQARDNNTASTLNLNRLGGTVAVGSTLTVAGAVTAPSYNSTSSQRYKTNVKPLENSLEIINKLQGVRFDWKKDGVSDVGLIAEQVNEILPEFVGKDPDGTPHSVDYGKITSVLIEAVKELYKKIN